MVESHHLYFGLIFIGYFLGYMFGKGVYFADVRLIFTIGFGYC